MQKCGGNALVVIVGAQFLEQEPTETEAVPTVPSVPAVGSELAGMTGVSICRSSMSTA